MPRERKLERRADSKRLLMGGITGRLTLESHICKDFIEEYKEFHLGNASQHTSQPGRQWLFVVMVLLIGILAGWGWTSHQKVRQLSISATAILEESNAIGTALADAEAQKTESEQQAQISLAYQLAAQAQYFFATDESKQMTAMLLAIESMRLHPNESASQILYNDQLTYLVSRVRHGDGVNFVAFSPNGKYLISAAGHDNTIRTSEVETGREIARVVHNFGVWSADISPDGQFVVSGGGDGFARVWEIDTGNQIATMAHGGVVWTVAFSPDGKYVISSSQDQITRLWEAQTGREIARLMREGSAPSAAFSPDGRYLIDNATTVIWIIPDEEFPRLVQPVAFSAVSPDGRYLASHTCEKYEPSTACGQSSIYVWDTTTSQAISHMVQSGGITTLAFSPDARYLVAGSHDNAALLWETKTGKEVFRKTHPFSTLSAIFSSDGQYIVSGGGGIASVWRVPLGEEWARTVNGSHHVDISPDGHYIAVGAGADAFVWKIDNRREVAVRQHNAEINCLASSVDGRYIASGSEDGIARVWDVESGRQVARAQHDGGVTSIAFSPDGKYVVSASRDGAVRVWESGTSEEVSALLHDSAVTSVAFSSDSRYVVSAGGKTVHVWEAQTGKEISRMTYEEGAAAAAFSPDSKLVISGGCDVILEQGSECFQGSARVWNAQTGKELARMNHDYLVQVVSFNPDGKYVISAGDQTARVWAVDTGREIARMTSSTRVLTAVFSPDGKYVISDGVETASLWEANTGREIHALEHDDFVGSAMFSSDGKYVLTRELNNNNIHVWDANTGERILHLAPEFGVLSVAFSSDNQYLVIRGRDHAVHVLKYRPEDLIADACMRVTRNLTLEEWGQFIGDALPRESVCSNLPLEPEPGSYYWVLPTPIPGESLDPVGTQPVQ